MLRKLSLLAVVVLASFRTTHAQGSDPQGAAAAFIPAAQGVTATDLCIYPNCAFSTNGAGIDLAGSAPRVVTRQVANCPISGTPQPRFEFDVQMVTPAGSVQTLGTFREYCSPPNFSSSFLVPRVAVDPFHGTLYIDVEITNRSGSVQITNRRVQEAVTGLATLAEILLSYEPAGGALSWRTPGFPLGLPSADRFEIYTGALGHVPLFTDAQPIDCSVPAAGHPAVGEYISIADPLPDPPVGEGRYVVVAVEQGSETRFGRQRMGGVTSGRDPGDFPACQ